MCDRQLRRTSGGLLLSTTVLLFFLKLTSPLSVVGPTGKNSVSLNQKHSAEEDSRLLGSSASSGMVRERCCDGLCFCYEDIADCSAHADGLSYIPALPPHINVLNFSDNGLTEIGHVNFFENATHIASLSMASNKLTKIVAGAFRRMKRLYALYLDFNPGLPYTAISRTLNVPTLWKLSVRRSNLGQVPEGFFINATLPRLKVLRLYDNFLKKVNLSNFMPLKGLTELGLANNEIVSFHVDFMDSLTQLNMNSNGLYNFPQTCGVGKRSLFPRLTHLLLRKNSISAIGRDVCLPRLRLLLLTENDFSVFPSDTFSAAKFPHLIELFVLSMNNHIKSIASKAFNNPSLQRITMTYNQLYFTSADIHPDSFANCTGLHDLQVSHNFLNVDEQRFLQLFGHLVQMKYLYLEDCEISRVTSAMFSGFIHLKLLSLNRNSLSVIPDGMFNSLAQLNHLDLSTNQITTVSPATFDAATRQQLSYLDVSDNPFTCDCDIRWFHAWLLSDPSIFSKSWGPYASQNVANTTVQQFSLNEQECLLSRTASVQIIVVLSLLILSLTSASILCRFRWHLRLLIYEVLRGRGDAWRRRLHNAHFEYDVFVSYDSDDLPWVHQHLMPELEERLGLRLCLHERDFIPGNNIVDNIVRCVQASKKVMMLFSENFVRSQWCQFELSLCLRHTMDIEDTLIVLRLDDVPTRDLTGAMMAVLMTTTYIQWEDHPDAVMAFWGRLRVALHEILGDV